ncbi:MAG: hypothetical protein GEU75_10450 [Dehalococcoidia bacterium]|nr:hypothetical protein [Dehalococcoidia bacterium]
MNRQRTEELAELVALSPTDELRRRCEEDRPANISPVIQEWHLKNMERFLRQAAERDELQASRPSGCWCLGIGGRNISWFEEEPDSPALYECKVYCDCDDGRRVQVTATEERARRRAAQRSRQVGRLLAEANIPWRLRSCTFDTYPASAASRDAFELVRRWATILESDDGRVLKNSLLLTGRTGVGKSGLAAAALRQLIEAELMHGAFWAVPQLLAALRPGGDSDDDLVSSLQEVDVLVLDDLGAEKPSAWTLDTLFTIIDHRHGEDATTIITSNLSLEQLAKRYSAVDGELDTGARLGWRIFEMAEAVHVQGPNLRDRADPAIRKVLAEADAVLRRGRA